MMIKPISDDDALAIVNRVKEKYRPVSSANIILLKHHNRALSNG